MKENKANTVETEERTMIVLDMLLSGLKRREILINVANNEELNWNICDSQIDNYISKANKIIKEYGKLNKKKIIAKARARYEFLYKELVNVKDYKSAASIVEKDTELAGVKIQKTELTGKNGKDLIPDRPIIVVSTQHGDIR